MIFISRLLLNKIIDFSINISYSETNDYIKFEVEKITKNLLERIFEISGDKKILLAIKNETKEDSKCMKYADFKKQGEYYEYMGRD